MIIIRSIVTLFLVVLLIVLERMVSVVIQLLSVVKSVMMETQLLQIRVIHVF